jgi:hypothetical protein
MKGKKTGWWQMDRAPSSHLLKELFLRHEWGVFTNEEAYDAYWDVCYTYKNRPQDEPKERAIKDDQFLQMNCRNQLLQATSQGRLLRIAPGLYEFR